MEVAVSIVRGKGFGLGVRTSCELMGARHTLSSRTKKGSIQCSACVCILGIGV